MQKVITKMEILENANFNKKEPKERQLKGWL
jgi:hypothetical protein